MKLYINRLSPNVRRVRLTAAVLGLELEEKEVDFGKGEHKGHPNGQVPTLVDGGFALSESRAIMQYLAAKKPESGLLPRDDQARADVIRWQFWDASQFSPQVGTLAFQRVLKRMFGMGEPDAAKVDEALVNFRRFAAVLDKHLEGRRYIVGNSLTLADLTLASSLMYAQQADVPLAEFPNIQALCSRIGDMDAWKATNP
jgi:glutathione S-transferase